MSQELLKKAVEASIKKDIPDFNIGDTVNVSVKIIEGEKERIQVFTGTVIGRRGSSISENFTVRRIVNNEGVERIFPMHSPKIAAIEVVRGGKVRRAKLYFLRNRVGKTTRLKDQKQKGELGRQDLQNPSRRGGRAGVSDHVALRSSQAVGRTRRGKRLQIPCPLRHENPRAKLSLPSWRSRHHRTGSL